jgi:hypothetical protein
MLLDGVRSNPEEDSNVSTHKKATKSPMPDGGATDHTHVPYEAAVEEIRTRAYEIYMRRGQIDGFDLEDWLEAEKELKHSRATTVGTGHQG